MLSHPSHGTIRNMVGCLLGCIMFAAHTKKTPGSCASLKPPPPTLRVSGGPPTSSQALIWTDFLPWNWSQTYQVWKARGLRGCFGRVGTSYDSQHPSGSFTSSWIGWSHFQPFFRCGVR